MFFFGHLGIGSQLIRPWSKGLSRRAILLGTILPDLIDKPLYYALVAITGKRGADLGLVSGTRTFGHTALFLLFLAGLALFQKSRILAAVALGVGSHFILDSFSDMFIRGEHPHMVQSPLFWPVLGGGTFPASPFRSAGEHLSMIENPIIFWSEVVGIILLAWRQWGGRIRYRRHKPTS